MRWKGKFFDVGFRSVVFGFKFIGFCWIVLGEGRIICYLGN